jgi:glycosyltransferase involved in cell wall biosynthesis
MAKLVEWGQGNLLNLAVMGSGHPEYEKRVRDLVKAGNLESHVQFIAPVSKDGFPDVLRAYDILIFPSIYDEPFARTPQEAMLAGMVVVGTLTGGTSELLQNGTNALTFAAQDAAGLARQLMVLLNDPELCRKLAINGRQSVMEQYTLPIMMSRVEEYLLEVMRAARVAPAAGTPH